MKYKICIIAKPPQYAISRMQFEIEDNSGQCILIEPEELSVDLTGIKPNLIYQGEPLKCDGIIHIMSTDFSSQLAMLQSMNDSITYLNNVHSVLTSANKFLTGSLMAKHSIPHPKTAICTNDFELKKFAHKLGYPLILKQPDGAEGKEVAIVESENRLLKTANKLRAKGATLIVQECIRESLGRDLRIVVIGGKVVAAMERIAAPGEFRANVHRGASTRIVELTHEENILAEKIAKVMNLDIVGIDMMRSKRGPLLIETNSFPGLESIETCSQANIAKSIVDLMSKRIEANTHKKHLVALSNR